MKKTVVCLLALILLLTGCKKDTVNKISVEDALCPYTVQQKSGELHIALESESLPDAEWQISAFPEDVCQIESSEKGDGVAYQVAGIQEGLAQLTIQATENGQLRFVLTVNAQVAANGKASLLSAVHRQTDQSVRESETLPCRWEVDMEGILTFSLSNEDAPYWDLTTQDNGVCRFSDLLYTSGGCQFEVTPVQAGTAVAVLACPELDYQLTVTLQIDDALQITVAGVEE